MSPRQPKPHPNKAITAAKQPLWAAFALGLALVAATLAAHFPATSAGYIWDDDSSLHENKLIASSDGLCKFWFSTKAIDYWPLSATTLWFEWRIWGNNPHPYHVTNIILHGLATVVLWRVLKQLNFSNAGAFLGGLLFAIHPVTVASSAWIAERKNVLSMTLYLFSILAYLRFEDQGRRKWYALALLAAAAALLAKTSVVALPVVLLLLSWWRQKSLTSRTVLRTAPFFLISFVLGLVTIWFQHNNAISGVVVRPEGVASRIASVGWVIWFYLYKIVVPVNLAMVYPRWHVDGGNILSYVPLMLLIACFLALWHYREVCGRGPLVALGSFVIVLAPVVGLVDMAFARYSLVADHLQYPGMPGIIALIAAGWAAAWSWAQRTSKRPLTVGITVVTVAIVLTLVTLTWRQAQVFKSAESLWNHNIRLNNRAWVAHYNRGTIYGERKDYDLAIKDYTRAIELRPDYTEAYNNRGWVYGNKHDYDREIQDCTKAIELKPDYADAYNNRGSAYGGKGVFNLAIPDYAKALDLKPEDADVYYNLGVAFSRIDDHNRAIQYYAKAIEIKPNFAAAYNNRGISYAAINAHDQAIRDYTQTISLKPDNADVYNNRAAAYCSMGNSARAIQDCNRAIELQPNYADAYNNRGNAYGVKGDTQQAIRDYTKAIKLKPDYAQAYNNRAAALFFLKQFDQAWSDVKKCRQYGGTLHPNFIKDLAKASGRTE